MAAEITKLTNGKVELNTTRLLLRAAVASDAEHLHKPFIDSEVMRYWSEPPHKDMTRTEAWMSSMINGKNNGITDFIICIKPDLQPIGKIGVWSGDEIGFLLDRSQWKKGLAAEALRGSLPYLFDVRQMESITADIDPRNAASLGILTKFGFEKERFEEKTLLIGDEWMDSVYLRLTKERWRAFEGV